MRVLVVDDSATMRHIIVSSLNRIGMSDTLEAVDGASGLTLHDPSIGLVIADWNMPDMSGASFTRRLRSTVDGRSVPVLLVVARSAKDEIPAAKAAGVTDHIMKPFTPQALKEKIQMMCPLTTV